MRTLILFLLFAAPAGAGELKLTLKAAEESALATSGQYQSAKLSAESAAAGAAAASTLLYPRLALEGSLRYASVVPQINLPPVMGGPKPMGDNWNYSIGPSAYWTLDTGALRYGRDASRRSAEARSAEAEAARRQTVLKARAAYFRLQLALEKTYLIGEDLKLAQSQLKDVELGVKAGSRSRLDGIRARQEATSRRRDLVRARADLGTALRDLAFETGIALPDYSGLPLDARMTGGGYDGGPGPLVRAEAYEEMIPALMPAASRPLDGELPTVTALAKSEASFRASALAQKRELLPRLTLGARSSIDYPNGPNIYSFLQNSASLALALPLFESGRQADRAREARLNAEAAAARRGDALRAAGRDYASALEDYNALMEEQTINVDAVDDADEAARLAYEAYKAGAGTWLDVESANLKALQAKTTLASANAEILLKLALLDSLTGSVK